MADPARERRGDDGGRSAWLKVAAPLLGVDNAPPRTLVVSGGDGDRRAVKATKGGGPRAARRTLPEGGDVETMTVEEHC